MKTDAIAGAGTHHHHIATTSEPPCVAEARAKIEADFRRELQKPLGLAIGRYSQAYAKYKKAIAELEGKHPGCTQGATCSPSNEVSVNSAKEFKGLAGENLLALFREDPDAFMKFMGKLDGHERQTMTMRLQDEMQAQNQLFNLMSNLQQAEHQTAKSVISNIRV